MKTAVMMILIKLDEALVLITTTMRVPVVTSVPLYCSKCAHFSWTAFYGNFKLCNPLNHLIPLYALFDAINHKHN